MKRVVCFLTVLLLSLALIPAAGALTDQAGLLSEGEQQALNTALSAISREHGMEVAVVTVKTTGGRDVWYYANDYYDEHIGGNGVLLLISEYEREWALVAVGTGYRAVNDDAQIYIEESILPLLKQDRFYDAFALYGELCAEMIARYEAGDPYETPFPLGLAILISLGIGLVTGLITVTVMKGKLKTVRRQPGAEAYTKAGSMKLTVQQDQFLYSNVSRTPRPKSNSSGGGGGSRGGRSGSF